MSALSPTALALLVLAAFIAGTIDAIAGGGGLLTVPALLATGMPTVHCLGTNKGQSVFGSFSALIAFWRAGAVNRPRARWTFALGFLGSLAGAKLVLLVPPAVLRPVVLAMLVLAGGVLTFRRPPDPLKHAAIASDRAHGIAALIALVLGGYDGFFGPGTGTFLIMAQVYLLGATMTRATGDAKVVNFASNLAAVAIFARQGVVLWHIALPMAAAQLAGGALGAHLAVKGGERVIRKVVLGVVIALVCKLTFDLVKAS